MLHQNFKQINMKDFFVAAEFPKTPSPKPARIPPQTPPAGGNTAEAGRILSPRQIVSPCRVRFSSFNHLDFARNSFELCPTNTASWEMKAVAYGCTPSHLGKNIFVIQLVYRYDKSDLVRSRI